VSLLTKLFGLERKATKTRVRVCVECGMPVEQHHQWCPIYRTRLEMERKRAEGKRDLPDL
jgi:hypothetical protein